MLSPRLHLALLLLTLPTASPAAPVTYISAMGNPAYKAADIAVQLSAWNFCNEALAPPLFPDHPSPHWADCTVGGGVSKAVLASDNALGPGDAFPLPGFTNSRDANAYAVQKELYLGALCSRPPAPASARSAAGANFSYSTVMFKSGNMDVAANVCPKTSRPLAHRYAPSAGALPIAAVQELRFNNLPMNQPIVNVHQSEEQAVPYGGRGLVGWVSGTYDVNASWTSAEIAAVQAALEEHTQAWVTYRFAEVDTQNPGPQPQPPILLVNKSFIAAVWWRNVSSGSMVFMHIQLTSPALPWAMNYLKLMDVSGVGGGYDWQESGDMYGPIPAYLSRLSITYTVLQRAQGGFGGLYVPCHGGCWKLNGQPCDGDLDSDITRYICFIAESGVGGCGPKGGCPPFHILSGSHERVFPNDTARFPYHCYSGHCAPGACDPYSNPGPQVRGVCG